MSTVAVTIDDRDVIRALGQLERKARNLRPAMSQIGAFLENQIKLSFHGGRDTWGQAWAPLKPSTIAKRRKGKGRGVDKPLRDTGRLMDSITHNAGRDSVEVGTNVAYAVTQQFGARKGAFGETRRGAPIPWGNVPARPFLPIKTGGRVSLPFQWRAQVERIIEQHLER